MSKNRYAPDPGLTARMGGTMFGLGLLYVVLMAVLIWSGLSAPVVVIIAAGSAWGQWYFSDRVAMYSMRARPVTPEQAPQLHAVVDRLCALADMPKPTVAIADTDMPNAFATGRSPKHAAVCVTTGLLRRLDPEELEGVLSHELSHVAHRDVMVMTVASFVGVLAGFLTRSWMWGGMRRRGNDQNSAVALLVIMAVSVLVYFASFVLTRTLSRYRELSADRSGALLTGQPGALARALQKISGDMSKIPTRDLRAAEPMNAFFIAPAFGGQPMSALFATHPPLEARLSQLARISAQLGQ
ncbi:MAG: zinc metalloprotease HtpX [Candidatus Nanopelagicales bacterium]